MIKVSVLYPNTPGRKFDMDYYCTRHLPMVRQRLGAACKGVAAEQGIPNGTPPVAPAFIAMGHAYFESVAAFEASWGQHAAEFVADILNYTDIQPTVQISEVKL